MMDTLRHLVRAFRRAPVVVPSEARIIRVIDDDPTKWWTGQELLDRTGLPAGMLYPALLRLERVGVLQSQWDNSPRYPHRRLYQRLSHRQGSPSA